MALMKPLNSAGALLLLVFAASTCWAAPFSTPSESPEASNGNSQMVERPGKQGNLRVKLGGARFLGAGNTVSATNGELQVDGFRALMKFKNISVENNRSAGVKATRLVKMPFSKGLERISNRAAAASVPLEPDSVTVQPYKTTSSMTPEERRQRILGVLRAILPAIRKRLLLMRMRQQQILQITGTPQTEGTDNAQVGVPCSKPAIESPEGDSSAQGGLASSRTGAESEQAEKIAALTSENKRLRRTVRALTMAVRGLLRHSIKLGRRLQRQEQQNSGDASAHESPARPDAEQNHASASTSFGPMAASAGETPQELGARRMILLRHYPSPVSDYPLK